MGWLGDKYKAVKDFKQGRNADGSPKYSDEDLERFTGKNRTDLEKFAANTAGVAGNQKAGSINAGGNSGLYTGEFSTFDVGSGLKYPPNAAAAAGPSQSSDKSPEIKETK